MEDGFDEDIDALLAKPERTPSSSISGELARLDAENLEDSVIKEADDVLQKSNDALSEILLAVQSSPEDNTLLAGAASFMKAHTALLAEINKINLQKDKLKHQEAMQRMKSTTNMAVAKMNNDTTIKLSREDATKRVKAKVVDADVVEEKKDDGEEG